MSKSKIALARGRRRLPLVRNISLIILSWSLSVFLVAHSKPARVVDISELTTLLFGAASIALFLLSIAIGAFAFFGWQHVSQFIRDAAKSATDSKIKILENELRGRVYSVLGHLVGEMGLDPTLKAKDREDKLDEAVANCRLGYELLKKVGGSVEFMGLNNLIYYSCAHETALNQGFVLAQARRLQEEAQNHSGPGPSNVLLTACRAILKYSIDPEERRQARNTVTRLLGTNIPERMKKEAQLCLQQFPDTEIASSNPSKGL
jgi:hypothetical protein